MERGKQKKKEEGNEEKDAPKRQRHRPQFKTRRPGENLRITVLGYPIRPVRHDIVLLKLARVDPTRKEAEHVSPKFELTGYKTMILERAILVPLELGRTRHGEDC